MSQRFSLYERLTVDQNIRFFGGIYGLDGARLEARRRFVLEMAGLRGREQTRAADLAGGWRQRLALGCAILHEPPIVFLDEPTGGVDPLSRREFWTLIDHLSAAGVTVLVTTHYLDEAEHCHRLAIIHAGRLAAIGTTAELKRVFEDRTILEVRAANPVEAMRLLDGMPEVEKTSVFGTAVHAVLKRGRRDAASARQGPAGGGRRGGRVDRAVQPSLEDVFLEVVERAQMKTLAVAPKEFRQIARDRRTLLILLFVPAFFLLLYGYALNFDIRHVRLAVDDRDRTPESRSLVSAFVNSGYFDLVATVDDDAEASRLMDRNDVRAVLVIPAGLGRAVRNGRPAAVQVLLNGDNANTATTVMGYALTIVRSESARYRPAAAPAGAARRGRAARLVQPGAAQHAVSGARAHRLHRDDHRRRLDGAVDRPREGARHDGAGADGAARRRVLRRRQDDALLRHLARVGVRHHPCRDGRCSGCRCAGRGCCCSSRCRCSSSARSDSACSSRAWPTPSRWRFRWRFSCRSCRR